MIDNRIYTFLTLCEVMNYHRTAEQLNMTQPAVTQHIKYLEDYYGCKLFEYHNRILDKTQKGIELEQYSRALVSISKNSKNMMGKETSKRVAIGVTKTIGEYGMKEVVREFIKDEGIQFTFIIDNTTNLLEKLNHFELDLLLLEGYFDKNQYGYKPMGKQELVGVCGRNHPFAGKEVELLDILKQPIIVRESGSGTREVFVHFLQEHNNSLDSFQKKTVISSYNLIESLVEKNEGISFVYDLVPNNNKKLAIFRIKGQPIFHEFNYVFFKHTNKNELIEKIETMR